MRAYLFRSHLRTVMAEKKVDKAQTMKLKNIQARLKKQGTVKDVFSAEDAKEQLEINSDVTSALEVLQEENAKMKAELRMYKSSVTQLKEKVENLRSDREVLMARNHVGKFNLEKKIKLQDKKLVAAGTSYMKLREYILQRIPDAELPNPEEMPEQRKTGFAYFHKSLQLTPPKGEDVVKNIGMEFKKATAFFAAPVGETTKKAKAFFTPPSWMVNKVTRMVSPETIHETISPVVTEKKEMETKTVSPEAISADVKGKKKTATKTA